MDEQLKKRYLELFTRADKQGTYVFTHFLDLASLNVLKTSLPSLPRVPYTLFGGAEGCERQMLCLGSEEFCGYDQPFPIACVLIAPANLRFAEKLTHRDFLGALMNLGIERELMGDIIVREEGAYLFCEDHIAPYIIDGLLQVRRTAVRCRLIDAPPAGELFQLKRLIVQLSSVRIDALIGHVYQLSRADAQSLVLAGKVFVDGRECRDTSYIPKEKEVISCRGFGRMRYAGVQTLSKKGKSNTAVDVFV